MTGIQALNLLQISRMYFIPRRARNFNTRRLKSATCVLHDALSLRDILRLLTPRLLTSRGSLGL